LLGGRSHCAGACVLSSPRSIRASIPRRFRLRSETRGRGVKRAWGQVLYDNIRSRMSVFGNLLNSVTKRSTRFNPASHRYIRLSRNPYTTERVPVRPPVCFAASKGPKIPRNASPRASAQRRSAYSWITAVLSRSMWSSFAWWREHGKASYCVRSRLGPMFSAVSKEGHWPGCMTVDVNLRVDEPRRCCSARRRI